MFHHSAVLLTGCPNIPQNSPCNFKSLQLITRVAITHIGSATRKFEVHATGFTPNAQARLSIQNFPKSENIIQTVTLDAGGSLLWTTNAPLLLASDPAYEPNAHVLTLLVEINSQCFGATHITQQAFAQF